MRNASSLHPASRQKKRSHAQLATLEMERKKWVSGIDPTGGFHRLFDCLPGVSFFAKDHRGRTMFASRNILELYQMKDESEMLGLSDHELNPAIMAEGYVRDDQKILSGTATHIERLELWFDRLGMPAWFFVTKLPVLNTAGQVHGIMGLLRSASENEKQLPVFQTVARAVELIRESYKEPLRVSEIAQSCGQSLRQLQRHFQSAFGATPQEFLLRTRLLEATRLLEESRLGMAEIALNCGFVDASAFTQHFRLRTGHTPAAYRQMHLTRIY